MASPSQNPYWLEWHFHDFISSQSGGSGHLIHPLKVNSFKLGQHVALYYAPTSHCSSNGYTMYYGRGCERLQETLGLTVQKSGNVCAVLPQMR